MIRSELEAIPAGVPDVLSDRLTFHPAGQTFEVGEGRSILLPHGCTIRERQMIRLLVTAFPIREQGSGRRGYVADVESRPAPHA